MLIGIEMVRAFTRPLRGRVGTHRKMRDGAG